MNEFDLRNALDRLDEVKALLSRFSDDEEAVAYLVRETGLPLDECERAYHFLTGFDTAKAREVSVAPPSDEER